MADFVFHRDGKGRLVGSTKKDNHGDIAAFSATGKWLGTYQKSSNQTVTREGRRYATGDATIGLLYANHRG